MVGSLIASYGIRVDGISSHAVEDFWSVTKTLGKEYKIENKEATGQKIRHDYTNLGRKTLSDNGEVIASYYSTLHKLIFKIDSNVFNEDALYKSIQQTFLEGKKVKDYIGYKWGDTGFFFVHDINFGGLFKVRIIKDRKSVVVDLDEGVNDVSINNFCKNFIDHVEPRVDIKSDVIQVIQ